MPGRRGLFVRRDSTAGTSPQDARLAIAGMVTPSGPLGVAPGVLSGCAVSGTSGWTYSVSAGHFVVTRGASDGATVASLDGATVTTVVAAAPASGSRYDLIWVRQRDIDSGDTDSTVVVGVTSGVASGTPARPTGDVPAGALVLAEARVYAGATSTAHANVTITGVAAPVAARGGVISCASITARDRLTTYATSAQPILAEVGGVVYRCVGGAWSALTAPVLYAEATGPAEGLAVPHGTESGLGTLSLAAPVGAGITLSGDTLVVAEAGIYSIHQYVAFGTLISARAYVAVQLNGVELARVSLTGDNTGSASVAATYVPAGGVLRGRVYQATGAPQTVNSHMRVNRVALV